MSNKTILFADDSVTMRTIMEKTFASEPFDVVTVPSGEAAISKVKEMQPDVIIVDAGMAGVSGYDVCQAVRDEPRLRGTPLMVLSGVSNQYDETRGNTIGVDEHMKKPFDTAQIIEKVTELSEKPRESGELIVEPSRPSDSAEVIPLVVPEEPEEDALTSLDAPLDLHDEVPSSITIEPEADVIIEEDEHEMETVMLSTEDAVVDTMMEEEEEPPARVSKETQTYPRPSQISGSTVTVDERSVSMEMPKLSVDDEVVSAEEVGIGDEHPIIIQDPEPIVELEPEVEPIEIDETEKKVDSGSFQVGTLAELAQMNNEGVPLQPESHENAIEIASEEVPETQKISKPVSQGPSIETAVRKKVESAASEIAASMEGVSEDQIRAIESLTRDVIEHVVWEVVPDLAETIIKEEIAKLLKE